MAVNTRDKRMSMIGLSKPNVRLLKNPSGSIDVMARLMLLFLYSGILPTPPAAFKPAWAVNSTNVAGQTPQSVTK